jgi:hypothetical protein
MIDGGLHRPFHARQNVGNGPLPVVEPFCRPEAMDTPSHALQYQLPEQIAIAGGSRAVLRDTVALDAQQVPTLILRIADGQVDSVAARADLHVHLQAAIHKGLPHGILEMVRFRVRPDSGLGWQLAVPFRECQEIGERDSTFIIGVDAAEVLSPEARNEDAFPFRPRDQDV